MSARVHILTTTRLVPDVNQCEAAGQFSRASEVARATSAQTKTTVPDILKHPNARDIQYV